MVRDSAASRWVPRGEYGAECLALLLEELESDRLLCWERSELEQCADLCCSAERRDPCVM